MKHEGTICQFVARALRDRLEIFRGQLPRLRDSSDKEGVHDVRVASRRLRIVLSLFPDVLPKGERKNWARAIRKMARALGRVRDIEVQLGCLDHLPNAIHRGGAGPGLHVLLEILRRRRVKGQHKADKALLRLEQSGVLQAMDQWAAENQPGADFAGAECCRGLRKRAGRPLRPRVAALLAYARYADRPERVKELHRMRIAAKRLRYGLEVVAPLYPDGLDREAKALRRVQTFLGEIHDADVWQAELTALEKEKQTDPAWGRRLTGIAWFRKNRALYRARRFKQWVVWWKRQERKHVWTRLEDR